MFHKWILNARFFSQGVLTQVTPATKMVLNRLGVFTVSSFHAYVCARYVHFLLRG
jgi:hypothetical protein